MEEPFISRIETDDMVSRSQKAVKSNRQSSSSPIGDDHIVGRNVDFALVVETSNEFS